MAATACIKAGGKIMFAGNGGSAADAQHLATELTVRYKTDRAPIAAIALTTDTSALTAIGNDFGFEYLFARQVAALAARMDKGIAVATAPDQRWARCDIKTVQLLPNLMAKQAARAAGAFEAWLVDQGGNVTEGGSTNAWIVDGEGDVVTRALSHAILPGVTRRVILQAAAEAGAAAASASSSCRRQRLSACAP
jgi:branched-subunit amino acid aminotransferase/4-amino-4-deoxychorismate lyase